MDADWEVEIGGGAPVIDAYWPGFIDLRIHPGRRSEIAEAVAFPPLAHLLLALNARESPVWTSKCDLWEQEPAGQACYIDLLPRQGTVFGEWQQAEAFCREHVGRLAVRALPECGAACSIDLVIRQAIAGETEGFGITAYLSSRGADAADAATDRARAATGLAELMAAFADALPATMPPAAGGSKLQ